MEKRIEKLKNKIFEHINAGGSIYDPKRELPYYEDMNTFVRYVRKKTGKDFTHDDAYKVCGIDFDREYNDFFDFLRNLQLFSTNKKVDKIKTNQVRKRNNVYERLKNYADKYNTTPFDFLVLMTPFEFDNCVIRTDNYQECLKYMIDKEYPNKDLTGIKRQYPSLYENLRQLQAYYPTPISMKTLVEQMGYDWPQASSLIPRVPSTNDVIKKLHALYPNGVVEHFTTKDPTLYMQAIKIARGEKKQLGEWLNEHGFSYPQNTPIPTLSRMNVDPDARAQLLKKLKCEALEKMNIRTTDPIELFHAGLDASKIVIAYINSQPTVDVLKLTDEINENQIER